MKFNIISPAMLKIFEECPRKFFYQYVQKFNLPKNKYLFEKGKKIHAIANYYLKGFDVKKLEMALNLEEKNIWDKLKQSEYFKMEIINTEYTISTKLGEFWIGGRLDALVKDKKNYYILDYKTGAIPKNPEKDYQTMVYLIAVSKLVKSNSIKFVYMDLKNNEEKIIKFSEKIKKEYENQINSACKLINQSLLNENFSKKTIECECEYYYFCENK